MKKVLYIFLSIILVQVSAFGFGVDNTMSTVMDSWKGCHIDRVIDRWGFPTEEKTIAGHKIYIWKTERIESSSGYTETKAHKDSKGRTYYTTDTYGGGTEVYTSERIIEVDENNIVIRGKWSGNDLPFTFMGVAKQWLNPTYELNK
ncbi:hypothetical protein IKE67_04310 [bacterium]|nr:hypothetical protein [bacterium]